MSSLFLKYKKLKSTCQGWYRKGAQYLYELLFKPSSKDEDDRRGERILTFILFFIILISIFFEIVIIIRKIKLGILYDGIPIPFFSLILLVYLILFFLTRKGYYKISGYIFIATFFAGALYGSFSWGASLPMGLLAYVLIVTMASIVISSRFGFIVAIFSCVAIITTGIHEHNIGLNPEWKQGVIEKRDVFGYGIMIGLTALLSRLSNKEMEKSLVRARTSEQELKHERDNLEIIVEERTRALRESERERIQELSRFAEFGKISSGIFHDLLNPLTAISLSVSEISDPKNQDQNSTNIKESVQTALNATKRMEQLMLAVRKQIKSDESKNLFSINKEITESIELMKYKARKSGVEIVFSADKEFYIFGNSLKFNQVITNLISNAIDSFHNQKILKSSEGKIVNIFLKSRLEKIDLIVSDNGFGIKPEIKDKIFNSFFTTKENSTGLGLGLSIIKSIVEEHFGGKIKFESSENVGTTFVVSFINNDSRDKPEKQNKPSDQERLEVS